MYSIITTSIYFIITSICFAIVTGEGTTKRAAPETLYSELGWALAISLVYSAVRQDILIINKRDIHMYTYNIYIYMLYVCMYVCMYVCAYIYIYIYNTDNIYIYIYIYICTHTHTHTHTRTHRG